MVWLKHTCIISSEVQIHSCILAIFGQDTHIYHIQSLELMGTRLTKLQKTIMYDVISLLNVLLAASVVTRCRSP